MDIEPTYTSEAVVERSDLQHKDRDKRVLMLPFPFLLPPLPNHHQNKYVELPS